MYDFKDIRNTSVPFFYAFYPSIFSNKVKVFFTESTNDYCIVGVIGDVVCGVIICCIVRCVIMGRFSALAIL